MKHHNKNRKFGRERNQRKALVRSLASALVEREKIKTTEAKAKELRPFIERLVTHGKKNSLASRRLIIKRLGSKGGGKKMMDIIAPRYNGRGGGYTRILKLPKRKSDGSKMAIIEFI